MNLQQAPKNEDAAVFLGAKSALIVYNTGESKPFAQIILFCSYNNSVGIAWTNRLLYFVNK